MELECGCRESPWNGVGVLLRPSLPSSDIPQCISIVEVVEFRCLILIK